MNEICNDEIYQIFGELILYSILMKQIISEAKLCYKLLFPQKQDQERQAAGEII